MDPVTHAVIGTALAKISGNAVDISNPAFTGMVIGSVFPDIDIVLQKWGDYVYLKNHRGVTHSLIGMLASSILITFIIYGIYGSGNVAAIFLWTLAGCFSHTFFDLFNSYGAKVLWPFSNKKLSLSLLIIFDPVFICLLVLYILSTGYTQYVCLGAFAAYLLSRILMRYVIWAQLKKKFYGELRKINILPSMTGLLRWHFILEYDKFNLIGEKNIFRKNVKILKRLDKVNDVKLDEIIYSPAGRFFSEFTPLFHVGCERKGGTQKYIFTDMRYYIRNNFLHHAVVETDEEGNIVSASFNPYSINRTSQIPM